MTTLERALARLKETAWDESGKGDYLLALDDAARVLTEALATQESAPAVVDAYPGEREQLAAWLEGMGGNDDMKALSTRAAVLLRVAPAREVPPVDDDTPLPLMPTGHYTVKATLTLVGDARERPEAWIRNRLDMWKSADAVRPDDAAETVLWALNLLDASRAERDTLRLALAEAAGEINCAGPLVHRIRVLKSEHGAEVKCLLNATHAVEAECVGLRETVSGLREERGRLREERRLLRGIVAEIRNTLAKDGNFAATVTAIDDEVAVAESAQEAPDV